MNVLNIGAGKLKPIEDPQSPYVLINLDKSYFQASSPEVIEQRSIGFHNRGETTNIELYCKEDAFEFMERTILQFKQVIMYRFLEHIPFDQVLYFIYLVSTITKKGSLIDVIVPDYKILATMLLAEDDILYHSAFEAHNVILTTEMLNEPGCPHASIWTPERIQKFWTLEGRFRVATILSPYKFDGREIYLRAVLERI